MARYHLVNTDGHRNAQIGDRIVTGGGVYQVTANGGVRVDSLPTATGRTTSQAQLTSIFNNIVTNSATARGGAVAQANNFAAGGASRPGGSGGGGGAVALPNAPLVNVPGFEPNEFLVSGGGSVNASAAGNVIGFVVLGLFGLLTLNIIVGGGD